MRKGKRTVKRSRKVGGSNMDDVCNICLGELIEIHPDGNENNVLVIKDPRNKDPVKQKEDEKLFNYVDVNSDIHIIQLDCGHKLHKKCFCELYFSEQRNCPVCRVKLDYITEDIYNNENICPKITLFNTNIKEYVNRYFDNTLTDEEIKRLGGTIGKWDVSRVKDMSYLFSKYTHTVNGVNNTGFVEFNNTTDTKLFDKKSEFNETLNWNVEGVTNMEGMFFGCTEFNNGGQPLNWNVENVTNMKKMFDACNNFNQQLISKNKETNEIHDWNVGKVTNMYSMFESCYKFNNGGNGNKPLNWNVGNVINMARMFFECQEFNQTLNCTDNKTNNWNLENVENMKLMFNQCENFNNGNGENPLIWNVGRVKYMEAMFSECHTFNQKLEWTNIGKVTMNRMFFKCHTFNQTLNWNVENVENMSGIFEECENFNNGEKPLEWNVKNVTNMKGMFENCINFNQELNWNFNVKKNVNMVGMFANCRKFNKELKWNVENVENMGFMFYFCEDFNNGGKPLKWNVEKVKSMYGMFEFCKNLKVPITFLNFNNECDTEDIIKGIPDENNLVINKNENKLVINQPTANQPTANQPTANQPTSNPPTANQPTTNQPTTEKKSYFKGFMGFQKYFKRGGRITRKQKGKKVHQKKSRKILLLKTK